MKQHAATTFRRTSAFAILLSVPFLLLACQGGAAAESQSTGVATAAPSQASVASADSDQVLATIDGKEITLADLEELVGGQLGQMDFQYWSRRHMIIDQAMRGYVRDQLIESEAAGRGMTVEALMAEVVGDKGSITDDEVRFFYMQNQAQLQGRPYDAMAPQIREYLGEQASNSVLTEYADELAEARDIDYILEPFRVDIDIEGSPVFGPADAVVTVIEFSDFECPYCKQFIPTLERIKSTYPDTVRVIFKQFPLREIHPLAQKAAEASLCALEQGKFWETHDLYFAEQDGLDIADLEEKAGRLGLDTAAFSACLSSGKYLDMVDADIGDGAAVGVSGTPAIFVNGRPLPPGAVPFEMVAEVIDDELERLQR